MWRTTYDYGGGNRVSVTPPAGGTPTAQITDARGRVIERRQYKAATPTGDYDATTYTYTPAGQIASVTDPSGNTFTTTYDLRGRKTKTTDPDKGTTTYTYNDLDQITSTTDARGKKIFVDYDGQGRKTATHDGAADGPVLASWAYDTSKRGKGKLASATRHTADGDYISGVYNYDTLGRPGITTLTIPASQGLLAGTYAFSASYNADGTPKGQGLPAAGGLPAEAIAYTYDTWQRPTKMIGNATYINTAQYTPTGKLVLLEYGTDPAKQAWQTFTYEYGTQRLATARTYRAGIGGADRHATYHYTDAGAITSITDTSRDGVDNQCFTYDHLQRLTQAWTQNTTDPCASEPASSVIGGPAPYWHTFTYDTAGNRKAQTLHGIGDETDTTRTYTYAATGQGNRLNSVVQTGGEGDRTDTYTYDATGNTTTRTIGTSPPGQSQTLDWDTEGELTKVTENGVTTSYIYDADGNRLIRKDATGTTLYMPDGTELRALTGATTATGTRYYTFAGKTVAMRTSDGTITYLTGDHQGTAQVAINAVTQQTTVRRFDPFGNIRGFDEDATWPGDKGFVGGTQDPTGLTHLGAREYDPQTGRFISVDPLMDQADPQQMNGYTYANNNPVDNADADGTMCYHTPDGTECFNGDGQDRRPNKGGGYTVYPPHGKPINSGNTSSPRSIKAPHGKAWDRLGGLRRKYKNVLQFIPIVGAYITIPSDGALGFDERTGSYWQGFFSDSNELYLILLGIIEPSPDAKAPGAKKDLEDLLGLHPSIPTSVLRSKGFEKHYKQGDRDLLAKSEGGRGSYPKWKDDKGQTFLNDLTKLIEEGEFRYVGTGTFQKGQPPAHRFEGRGLVLLTRENGEYWSLMKEGSGIPAREWTWIHQPD